MGWLILLSLAKGSFYLGVVSFIGFCAMRRLFVSCYCSESPEHLYKPLLVFSAISLFFATMGVLMIVPLNAGMLMDEGTAGMLDNFMLQITWESSIGAQAKARFIALLMMVTALAILAKKVCLDQRSAGVWMVTLASVVTVAWSFTQSGHTAAASWLEQALVAVHIVVAGWWIGSFYPLIKLCQLGEPSQVKAILHQYGKQAVLWVAGLIISGSLLLFLLYQNVAGEVNTTYLSIMAAKLALVIVMLGFAAYHKWRLVAKLNTKEDCFVVRKSIIAEAWVGVFVLVVTATLTTGFGIAH